MVTILVMDDEPSLRNILATTLKNQGHTIFTAEDGRQAVELAKRNPPNLALLDIQVPDMDGLEVLNELKKINPDVRGIMLSGSADVEIAVSTIKQGAFDFLSKPFKIDEVISVVNKAITAKASSIPSAVRTSTLTQSAHMSTATPVAERRQMKARRKITLNTAIIKKAAIAASAVIAVIIIAVLGKNLFQKSVFTEYSIPYSNPTGMCWIKPNIWVSDWVTGNIYKHNIDDKLSIASVYKTGNVQPTGLAFDGEYLWTCNSIEQRIYKHSLDESLAIEAIYSNPDSNPIGLYFDGVNLWILDSNTAKIYKHKMDATLSVIGEFDSPAINPCGMFRVGEYFYIGDYNSAKIYKVSVKDFSVSEVYTIEHFTTMNYNLASITWDGKNIWASSDETGKIFCLSFNNLKAIRF